MVKVKCKACGKEGTILYGRTYMCACGTVSAIENGLSFAQAIADARREGVESERRICVDKAYLEKIQMEDLATWHSDDAVCSDKYKAGAISAGRIEKAIRQRGNDNG